MRRHKLMGAACAALLIGLASGAEAQTARSLAPGQTVSGEMAADGDAAQIDYTVEARRGQRLEAVLRSSDFDAYLELFTAGSDEPLALDDDGLGEGTDARLRFTAPADGPYTLRASPLGEGGGAYSLTLSDRGPASAAPRPGGIRIGQTVRGALGDRDPETDEGGSYDAYLWRARAGERALISLDSEAFDPIVRIGREADGVFEELAQNDDGADTGLNSRLVFVAPSDGAYVIRATALQASGEGAYVLKLERAPEPPAAIPISIGDSVTGELGEAAGKDEDAATAVRYRFAGRARQRVRIDMASGDFDAFLELFDGAETSLATDDDGAGDGTDARLTYTLPTDGEYLIEARAFADAAGGFTLTLAEAAPEKPAQALEFGATVQGEIGEDSSRDDEGKGFDAYAFSGREGQRVQAIMRSGDFDTYLQIGRANGEFEALASDDDGLGEGTDSRLNFTLPEDGDYVVRASPLSPEGEGLYALELKDRGPQPQPGSVLVGAVARGVLTETDATADDNSFFDAYRVVVRKDEKLLITLVSNEVDSFLSIGRAAAEGEPFEVLASDDDGLSDTHAKLEWTAPDDGAYEIRAGTFQQGQTGAYALTVDKQP